MAKVGTLKCDIKIDTTKFQKGLAAAEMVRSTGVSASEAAAAFGGMNKALAKSEKIFGKEILVTGSGAPPQPTGKFENCKWTVPADFSVMESSLVAVPANDASLIAYMLKAGNNTKQIEGSPKTAEPKPVHRRVVTFEKDSP